MFNLTYTQMALGVAGICGGAVAASIICKFLRWMAEAVWRGTNAFVEQASTLLIYVTAEIGGGLRSMVATVLTIIWNAIFTAMLCAAMPVKVGAVNVHSRLSEYCKLRVLYWKYGHVDFKTFAKFRRHLLGEEEPGAKAAKEEQQKRTALQEAQDVMGFSGSEPNSQTELKSRHRELLSLVHPDKGCPSQFFARQVNEAVATIMSVRKWK